MYLDWLLSNLIFWLAGWDKLINKMKQYKKNFFIWLRDTCFM